MTLREETIPVREAHRLNVAALAEYLRKELKGFSGNLTVHQFGFGQSNPTFLISAGGREYVLRKKPPGKLLPSAHAVDREYRIIKARKNAGVSVPEPYLLCADESVIGTPFYVMERVWGRIFGDPIVSDVRWRPLFRGFTSGDWTGLPVPINPKNIESTTAFWRIPPGAWSPKIP